MNIEHSVKNSDGKFIAKDDGTDVGKMTYHINDSDTITILHTEVDNDYQGQGIASDLLREMTEFIRDEQLQVKIKCSYVAHQYKTKETYSDINIIT